MTVRGDADQATGRIFDLGYQPYAGPRLGRGQAVKALLRYSLRRAWGIGRPFRTKLMPWGLSAIALVPALIVLGIRALIPVDNVPEPIRYENYYGLIAILLLLFSTSVAPEMLCPDRRQRVLSLYFSRSLGRLDYVGAKLGALSLAMFAMAFTPEVFLFVGNTVASKDTVGYLKDNLDEIPRIIAAALVVSLYFSSISLAVASFAVRRVFAGGAFIALMLISTAVTASVHGILQNDLSRYLTLLSLSDVPIAATNWIFGATGTGAVADVDLPQEIWVLATIGYAALALAVFTRRYVRLTP